MQFLYSSPAGMIDFIVMVVVCSVGLWFGGRETAVMVLALVVAYLFDRIAKHAGGSDVGISVISAAGSLAAIGIVFSLCDGIIARAFATLYGVKVVSDLIMSAGLIELGTSNLVLTVVVYLQMLLIIGGAIDAPTGGSISSAIRLVAASCAGGLSHLLYAVGIRG